MIKIARDSSKQQQKILSIETLQSPGAQGGTILSIVSPIVKSRSDIMLLVFVKANKKYIIIVKIAFSLPMSEILNSNTPWHCVVERSSAQLTAEIWANNKASIINTKEMNGKMLMVTDKIEFGLNLLKSRKRKTGIEGEKKEMMILQQIHCDNNNAFY